MLDYEFYFEDFLKDIYEPAMSSNEGGMSSPDMFTLFIALKNIRPDTVIESGVWNGWSTKLIRKSVGEDCKIICLDPRDVPKEGFKDTNPNTTYYTGGKFIDFKDLDLKSDLKTLAFFDDHIDVMLRLKESKEKNIKHLFFNDNYPVGHGSHRTLTHIFSNEKEKKEIEKIIKKYLIFPNVFKGTVSGVETEGYFEEATVVRKDQYWIFFNDRKAYRWNTYVELCQRF
jgi:hypothetical protein